MNVEFFHAWWLIKNQPQPAVGKDQDWFYKQRLTQVSCHSLLFWEKAIITQEVLM